MIKLVVYKEDVYNELDIDQNESIEIQYEMKGLDIENRSSSFSKSFTLPGTSINNRFFENNFTGNNTLDLINFNCKLFLNGSVIIEGVLILDSINTDKYGNNTIYNVSIEGKFYDFLKSFGNDLIVGNSDSSKDIDFSDIEIRSENYTTEDMLESWSGSSNPFVYTIANYGYNWDNGTQWKIGPGSGGAYTLKQDILGVFPSIYVKNLLDRIFKKAGIKYKSNFLNTETFKKLIILSPVTKVSDEDLYSNQFLYTEQPSSQNINSGIDTQIDFDSNTTPSSTYIQNNEFISPSIYTYGKDNYVFEVSGYIETLDKPGSVIITAQYWNGFFWTDFATKDITPRFRPPSTSYNDPFVFTCNRVLPKDQKVRFMFRYNQSPTTVGTGTATLSLGALNITSDKRAISGLNFIPSGLKISEFLITIFRMFNLVVYEKNNELYIEPYRDYYDSETILDLTNNNIVDKTSYLLTPLINDIPNNIIGTQELGEDDLSISFNERYTTNYGNAIINVNGNSTEKSIELKSILTQYEKITGFDGPFVPYCYKTNNSKREGINVGLRIVYYNGLQPLNYTYYIDENPFSMFPVISNLSELNSNVETIKFGPITSDRIDTLSTINNLTSNLGLISNYYSDELSIYNIKEYKLTIKLNLKFDVNFDLNTKVYLNINGIPKYYRIERIVFSSDPNILTEMDLLPLSSEKFKITISNSEGSSGTSSNNNNERNSDNIGSDNMNNGEFSYINGNYNIINYSKFINVNGEYNYIGSDSNQLLVVGNNNIIKTGSTNSIILGENNIVPENDNGGIWINGERLNEYKQTYILTSGDTNNLHSIAVEVLPIQGTSITSVIDAYMSIEYPDGVTPIPFGNTTITLNYGDGGGEVRDQLFRFDNHLFNNDYNSIHRGVPTYDVDLTNSSLVLIASSNLANNGNGILKLIIYYRLIDL
jgi:hypothetical protein